MADSAAKHPHATHAVGRQAGLGQIPAAHGTGISPDDYNALVDERDAFAAALRELTKPKYGVATMVVAHKALGLDFEIPTVEESDDDLNLRY